MKEVYLVCGVSGVGKSWVCSQLAEKFAYVPHDQHYDDIEDVVVGLSRHSTKPIITECPFGERVLREKLEAFGVPVIPVFVIEPTHVVRARFEAREKRELPKNVATRSLTILDRAMEWNAKHGTSEQILQFLKELEV